ncbi:MAG: DNA helicase [Patescibacteria group bacterium]
MKIIFSDPFQGDFVNLPLQVQRAFEKSARFLFNNPRHPSLQVKKLPGTSFWYGRVTLGYRFTFQWAGDSIVLRRIGTHDILNKERRA